MPEPARSSYLWSERQSGTQMTSPATRARLAVDIGGTFTDLALEVGELPYELGRLIGLG